RSLRERPESPPAPDVVLEEAGDGPYRQLAIGDAAEETMAGVAGDHPTWAVVAVEREREHAFVLEPEVAVEVLAEVGRALLAANLVGTPTGQPGDARHAAERRVRVRLHLGECDGRLRQTPVGVRDGVVRVLPPLVDQAVCGAALVGEVATVVAVGVTLDPRQRRLRSRPQLVDQRPVRRALQVLAEQQEEQRRRVDAAIVSPEWDLAGGGHLA